MICDEMNNKEISERLHISVRTVERHRENIMQKMGVKNTVGMVIYAIKNRLVK
jgi:DNA-binding NarL/FixJ family response regulator